MPAGVGTGLEPRTSVGPLASDVGLKETHSNSNSNSNWTFIALNLPKQEDSKAQQNKNQSTSAGRPRTVSWSSPLGLGQTVAWRAFHSEFSVTQTTF